MKIGPIIFGEKSKLITYMKNKKLLSTNKTCRCGSVTVQSERLDVDDGV